MATLMFRSSGELDEAIRLRDEINELNKTLESVGGDQESIKRTAAEIEKLRKKLIELTTEAAKAGKTFTDQLLKIAQESTTLPDPDEELKTLLGKYSSYAESRKKIEEKYAAEIEKMRAAGKTSTGNEGTGSENSGKAPNKYAGNIAQAERLKQEELSKLDKQVADLAKQSAPLLQTLFTDVTTKSIWEMRKMVQEAKLTANFLAAEKITDSDEYKAGIESGQYKVGDAVFKNNKGEVTDTISQKDVLDLGFDEGQLDALEKSPDKIKEIEEAYGKLQEKVSGSSSFEKLGAAIKQAFEPGATKDIGAIGKTISGIGTAAASVAPDIKQLGADLTQASGNKKFGETANSIATGITGVAKTAEGVGRMMSGDLIGGAMSAISGITSLITLFSGDVQREARIQAMKKEIDALGWSMKNTAAVKIDQAIGGTTEKYKEFYAQVVKSAIATHNLSQTMKDLTKSPGCSPQLIQAVADAYGSLGYSVDKALGEKKYSSSRGKLENLAQQQALVQRQMWEEQNKKSSDDDKVTQYQRKMQELGAEMTSLINNLVEDIMGSSSDKLATELGDAFFDAFKKGENAAEAWGAKVDEVVAGILKRLLIQTFLTEPIAKLFDTYKEKWFKNGTYAGVDVVKESMGALKDDLNKAGTDFEEVIDALPQEYQDMLGAEKNKQAQATSRGFETMTQDTGNELNGRFSDIQGKVGNLYELLAGYFTGTSQEMTGIQQQAYDIANENRGFLARHSLYLEQIVTNTGAIVEPILNLSARIDRIDTKIQEL